MIAVRASIGLLFAASICRADGLVEVVLQDRLDEPRGYCLDIVGHQTRAMPERGLHAHSCYSYQGRIAVDQGFDAKRIAAGEFYLPGFEVCVTVGKPAAGARLMLARCDDRPGQRHTLQPDGRITPHDDPAMCATVARGDSTPGGGGSPAHLLRQLTLQPCSEALQAYQRWRLRGQAD